MTDRAKIRVVIEYETQLGDPGAYEGATTAEAKAAKEVEYIQQDGDYLISVLASIPHTLTATATVIGALWLSKAGWSVSHARVGRTDSTAVCGRELGRALVTEYVGQPRCQRCVRKLQAGNA